MIIFFYHDTATTDIYTLSLHDALPISGRRRDPADPGRRAGGAAEGGAGLRIPDPRSEEHTSELQSLRHLVCRLLLEKKKITIRPHAFTLNKNLSQQNLISVFRCRPCSE